VAIVLGTFVLREPHGRQRVVGAILIVIGVALLASAPAA
jgi:drug/metabolite transporter (DMT)-like permease